MRKDQRSAVTNGKRLHVVSPGDTAWSRRFRDILSEIVSDLGGHDRLSEGQRQLARRAATISIACERLEGEAAAGTPIDLDCYGQLTDRLGRCLQRLGLKRVPKPVPTIAEHMAHIMRERAANPPPPDDDEPFVDDEVDGATVQPASDDALTGEAVRTAEASSDSGGQ